MQNPLAFVFLLPILAIASPSFSAECALKSDEVKNLYTQARSRKERISRCVWPDDGFDKSKSRLQPGDCDPPDQAFDKKLAANVGCFTESQLSVLSLDRNLNLTQCAVAGKIGKEYLCAIDWKWLEPYEERARKELGIAVAESQAKYEKALEDPRFLIEEEKSRAQHLTDCAEHGRGAIEMGGVDGTCAVDYRRQNKALAKAGKADKFSPEQLGVLETYRKSSESSCATIRSKIPPDSNIFTGMCGADWSWLVKQQDKAQVDAARARMNQIIGQKP